MTTLAKLNQRLNDLCVAFYKLALPAVVKETKQDSETGQTLVRVSFEVEGEAPQLTGFVPVFAAVANDAVKVWSPVLVGDRGILISPGGMTNSGWFLSGLYSTATPPPIDDNRDRRLYIQHGDITVDLNAADNTLKILGTESSTLAGNLRVEGDITATGDLQVDGGGTITGALRVDSGVRVGDDIVTDKGISHNSHTHLDTPGMGAGVTSPPQ